MLEASEQVAHAKLIADAWCAAFVIEKTPEAPVLTQGVLELLERHPEGGDPKLHAAVRRMADRYRFLHPHLAFPQVFQIPEHGEEPDNPDNGWSGGFHLVVGNPPWERVKVQDKEWFTSSDRPDIAEISNSAARKRAIAALEVEDPTLFDKWITTLRRADGEAQLLRRSGRYPLAGQGDINTYAVFAESMRNYTSSNGRTGAVLPLGIATDSTTKDFFGDLAMKRSLVRMIGFENEEFLFPAVHHATKFVLLTMTGSSRPSESAEFAFYLRQVASVTDTDRVFELTADDFRLINPNTRTCPIFRSRRDADLTRNIYRRVPVLSLESHGAAGNPWGVEYMGMFHMTNDSALFKTRDELLAEGGRQEGESVLVGDQVFLPLFEGKMFHLFDHRFGTYQHQTAAQARQGKLPELSDEQHADAALGVVPAYWVDRREVLRRLEDRWDREWLVGFRDITGATVIRTVISSVIPLGAVGNQFPLILLGRAEHVASLVANLSSFVLDYIARQKVGGTHLNYFLLNQLPVLPPDVFETIAEWQPDSRLDDWMVARVLELTYTSSHLAPFARDLGYDGTPYIWNPERRAVLRAELDAAFFLLYGLDREDAEYVLDTFWVVKQNDEKTFGEYHTKRLILETYDAMWKASETGVPYSTRLDPPAADPRVAHTPT